MGNLKTKVCFRPKCEMALCKAFERTEQILNQ